MSVRNWFVALLPLQSMLSGLIAAANLLYVCVSAFNGNGFPLRNIFAIALCFLWWVGMSFFVNNSRGFFILKNAIYAGSFFGLYLLVFGFVGVVQYFFAENFNHSIWFGPLVMFLGYSVYELGRRSLNKLG